MLNIICLEKNKQYHFTDEESHHKKSSYADSTNGIIYNNKQKYQYTLKYEVSQHITAHRVNYTLFLSCEPEGAYVIMRFYQNTSFISEADLILPYSVKPSQEQPKKGSESIMFPLITVSTFSGIHYLVRTKFNFTQYSEYTILLPLKHTKKR